MIRAKLLLAIGCKRCSKYDLPRKLFKLPKILLEKIFNKGKIIVSGDSLSRLTHQTLSCDHNRSKFHLTHDLESLKMSDFPVTNNTERRDDEK